MIYLLNFLIIAALISCEQQSNVDEDPNIDLKTKQIIEANNDFAFNFFKKIDEYEDTEENFMVSPVSLSLALGMAYNGTNGQTRNDFEYLFGYQNASLNDMNKINNSLINILTSGENGALFEIANSVWYRNNFSVKKNFIDQNKTYYNAEVQALDFSSPGAIKAINDWVSEKTHEKITSIVDEISPDLMLMLINALYFNNNWQYEFSPEDNVQNWFSFEDGSDSKLIDMMSLEANLKYQSNEVFSAVILPYKDQKYCMTLMLPNHDRTTSDVISALNGDFISSQDDEFTENEVVLTMPKFKFEYKNILNQELMAMGLGIAFSDSADFSGISDVFLKISFVVQKTYIDVNEKGTEAAAVTAIGFVTTSIDPSGPQKIFFTLNKPFVFVITEKVTNAVCFIGRVGNPEYED